MSPSPPQRFRRPLDWAVLFLFLLLLVVGLVQLFRNDTGEPETGPRLIDVRSDKALEQLTTDTPFFLELELEGPLYVAVYRFFDDGRAATRLFPPLGDPQGLPWPLTTRRGDSSWRLPAGSDGFLLRREGSGRLVVFSHTQGNPIIDSEILAAKPPYDELAHRSDGAVLKIKVRAH